MLNHTLTGTRLTLRAPQAEDVNCIYDIVRNDSDIQRWTSVPSPYTREDAQQFVNTCTRTLDEAGSAVWMMQEITTDPYASPIGVIELRWHEATGEIGLWLASSYRGHGLGEEATRLVLDYAFDALHLDTVHWLCEYDGDDINWASAKVAWKVGFVFDGRVRGWTTNKGDVRDVLFASIRSHDPRTPQHAWFGPDARHPAFGDSRQPEDLVRQFHSTYGLPIATDAPNADRDRVHMRLALVAEEFAELVGATYGTTSRREIENAFARAQDQDDHTRDTVEVADALGDLVYVIYGMSLELGIPMRDVLAEIQASNLSKLGADHKPIYREDGKVLKGPNYFPPNIKKVLGI